MQTTESVYVLPSAAFHSLEQAQWLTNRARGKPHQHAPRRIQHPAHTRRNLLRTRQQRRRTRRITRRRPRPRPLPATPQRPRLRRRHHRLRPRHPRHLGPQPKPQRPRQRSRRHHPGCPGTRLRHRRAHPRHRPVDDTDRNAKTRTKALDKVLLRPPHPLRQRPTRNPGDHPQPRDHHPTPHPRLNHRDHHLPYNANTSALKAQTALKCPVQVSNYPKRPGNGSTGR